MVNEIRLRQGSALIFTVPTGDMPLRQANEMLDTLKARMKELFPDNEVILMPSRGDRQSDLTVIHPVHTN